MTNKSEVKVGLSQIELETDELNIVKPDGREPFSVHGDQAHISKLLIDRITTSSKFIENMKAIHLDFGQDLKTEVSALRAEVSELKQKLEER